MLTARRLRERVPQAPAPAELPQKITPEEHQRALQELARSYEIKLSEARAAVGKGKTKELRDQLDALQAEFDKLTSEQAALVARVTERGAELGLNEAEIAALLNEDAPVPGEQADPVEGEPPEAKGKGKPKGK